MMMREIRQQHLHKHTHTHTVRDAGINMCIGVTTKPKFQQSLSLSLHELQYHSKTKMLLNLLLVLLIYYYCFFFLCAFLSVLLMELPLLTFLVSTQCRCHQIISSPWGSAECPFWKTSWTWPTLRWTSPSYSWSQCWFGPSFWSIRITHTNTLTLWCVIFVLMVSGDLQTHKAF